MPKNVMINCKEKKVVIAVERLHYAEKSDGGGDEGAVAPPDLMHLMSADSL